MKPTALAELVTINAAMIVILAAVTSAPADHRRGHTGSIVPAFDATTGAGVVESPANTFIIPRCYRSNKLGYVTARWSPPLTASVMSVTYTLTLSPGAVLVGYESGATGTRLALHFQRRGDNKGQSHYDQGYRQWSRARAVLQPGTYTFEVPLTSDNWTHPNGFDASMRNVDRVGFTVSDTNTAGHGICMKSGTGSITAVSFSIR
jgi:hypothetical protein